MFTLTETSKRKKEHLMQVFERITPDRDGRLVLKRDDEGHEAINNTAMEAFEAAATARVGLQKIGDQEEVFEDSNTDPQQLDGNYDGTPSETLLEDDDEPIESSESNDLKNIKSILKNKGALATSLSKQTSADKPPSASLKNVTIKNQNSQRITPQKK